MYVRILNFLAFLHLIFYRQYLIYEIMNKMERTLVGVPC